MDLSADAFSVGVEDWIFTIQAKETCMGHPGCASETLPPLPARCRRYGLLASKISPLNHLFSPFAAR
jgi:hypothetical protein